MESGVHAEYLSCRLVVDGLPRKPRRREKRVTDNSRMSCPKVASLGKVTQFHVGEIRHSFHVFRFFATNKSEKGTNKI